MASLQEKSVGAGLFFMKDQIASIHMVATLTDFRRKHVATTVTLEAIRRARKDKADLVWLRTRKGGTGEKVYTKIGFTSFSDILSYTKTPQHEDTHLPPK
jgi:ribosomal protein S18 acetylase RimI-like enzyme